MKEEYWVTADGRKIAIADMTLSHLQNTLRKLIREKRILPPCISRNAIQNEIQKDLDSLDLEVNDDEQDVQFNRISNPNLHPDCIDEINASFGCVEWWK